jgi:hypothetical protein
MVVEDLLLITAQMVETLGLMVQVLPVRDSQSVLRVATGVLVMPMAAAADQGAQTPIALVLPNDLEELEQMPELVLVVALAEQLEILLSGELVVVIQEEMEVVVVRLVVGSKTMLALMELSGPPLDLAVVEVEVTKPMAALAARMALAAAVLITARLVVQEQRA